MITVSAPGSLMILGEYAVLWDRPALMAAHSGRVRVSLVLGGDGLWAVSKSYGAIDLRSRDVPPTFSFVSAAFDVYQEHFPSALTLKIESDFPDNLGFGSSAAVTVATLGALWAHVNQKSHFQEEDRKFLWEIGRSVIQQVQGVGSGADVAASIWGGVVLYEPGLPQIRRIADTLPLVAVYSGAKRKTPEVVQEVKAQMPRFSAIFEALFEASRCIVEKGVQGTLEKDFEVLGIAMNIAQGLMVSYGVSNPLLTELVTKLRTQPTIWGAKISGAGLGDCVIGLGTLGDDCVAFFDPYPVFPIEVALEGITFDSP